MPVFLQQKINSFLCIAFISIVTFWVGLYYLSARAELIGTNWANSYVPQIFNSNG